MNIRLQELAKTVKLCNLVVDVGTDHAKLPIFLINNQQTQQVIAIENKILPLHNAMQAILNAQLQNKITLSYSDGLNYVHALSNPKFLIDYIIVSGVGGNNIADILKYVDLLNVDYLLLQPTKAEPKLRAFLQKKNWLVQDEKIIYANKVYYEQILCHKKKGMPIQSRIDIVYGPILYQKKSDLFIKKWQMHVDWLILHKNATNHSAPQSIYQKSITQIKKDLKI